MAWHLAYIFKSYFVKTASQFYLWWKIFTIHDAFIQVKEFLYFFRDKSFQAIFYKKEKSIFVFIEKIQDSF
jgi:hypothetical protein